MILGQTAVEGQGLPCLYLADHDLESVSITILTILWLAPVAGQCITVQAQNQDEAIRCHT